MAAEITINWSKYHENKVASYQNEIAELGWTLVEGLLDDQKVAELKNIFQENEENHPSSTSQLFTHEPSEDDSGMSHLMNQWLNPHRRSDKSSTKSISAYVRKKLTQIFGLELTLFQDVLMIKSPSHVPFHWHQDYPYWPVDEPRGLIVWIPLQPTGIRNGGLGLASGSHMDGAGPSVNLGDGSPQSGAKGSIPSNLVAEFPDLKPGDAIVFSPLTWHTSGTNKGPNDRLAWSSSWLEKSCKWKLANAPLHPLRGVIEDGETVGGDSH